MASITLSECWLHELANLSSFVRLPHSDLQIDAEREVSTRVRAGGRVVAVSRPVRHRTATFTAHTVDRVTLDRLDGWMGSLMMLRTPNGRNSDTGEVLFGFYSSLPASLQPDGLHSVPIVFQTVTHSIEV